MHLLLITSGGQTGVERGGLDAAVAAEVDYAGFAPVGGLTEDHHEPPGILAIYPHLTEMTIGAYAVRTEANVTASDATLLIARPSSPMGRNTTLAMRIARAKRKPLLVVAPNRPEVNGYIEQTITWLDALLGARAATEPLRLNVVGPRASSWTAAYDFSRQIVTGVLERFETDKAAA